MARLDDIIIKTRSDLFRKKQGTYFWGHTYAYESSDSLRLRSREECDWHYILSKKGIAHTYEPNLAGTRIRPDFGAGSNFIIEICGMVESPFPKKGEGRRRQEYKKEMAKKRRVLQRLGYNLVGIYKNALVLNSRMIRNARPIPFVLDLIQKYNPEGCAETPCDISFYRILP